MNKYFVKLASKLGPKLALGALAAAGVGLAIDDKRRKQQQRKAFNAAQIND